MAYAMTHQWQAGSRQQTAPSGFEPDKSNWGWNWLERWMAVRPWENRFLDSNLRDGVMLHEDGSVEGNNGIKTPLISAGKKTTPSNHTTFLNKLTALSHSDGSGSPSCKSVSAVATSNTLPKSSPPQEESIERTKSRRPTGIGSRSCSNHNERSTQPDKQVKKRLSLPNTGNGTPLARRPSANFSNKTPNSEKPKVERRRHSEPPKSAPREVKLQS